MDENQVDLLQERIDDAAENLKSSEKLLEAIKTKLKVLQDATSEKSSLRESGSAGGKNANSALASTDTQAKQTETKQGMSPEAKLSNERAIRAFNLNPRRGIELVKEKVGGAALAEWLLTTPGLNKGKIGEWLGDTYEENVQTLAAFAFAFSFQRKSFEDALRTYCSAFEMPLGESKKVDRICEAFANSYAAMNPGAFSSVDVVHILSFSCVMLNLEVHRLRDVRVKSEEAFLANHRGMDDGGADRKLLTDLYRSITSREFTSPVERADEGSGVLFTDPVKIGWLRKQGGRAKSWTKRLFIYCDSTLFYFENEHDIDPKGLFFPVENMRANTSMVNKKQIIVEPKVGGFLKSAKFDKSGEMVNGNHKTLVLTAPSQREAGEWAALLNK
mmetsp:Transcript_74120/g.149343  ORF Transcript_74120/g.149343 Transcript_74120/m.149343 type:complete len:388 (+) Transcript_74120:134-1297(+)